MKVTFEPFTQGIRFLDWDFGDGKHSGDIIATHTYASEGTYDVCLEMTDFCGFTDKKCRSITVSGQVGVEGRRLHDSFIPEIYPNPATSSVTVKAGIPGNKTIRTTDLIGNEALPSVYTAQEIITIDVSSLAKGIYIISINQVTQKLIIQ